ncbi:MAG: hypothetical protein ACREFI_16485, partial [Stellaceae bacterium]
MDTAPISEPPLRPLDWQRIDRWTRDIAGACLAEIAQAFAANALPAPTVCWTPSQSDLPAEPLRVLFEYWSTRETAGGDVPHYRQIDPLAMRRALGFIMI